MQCVNFAEGIFMRTEGCNFIKKETLTQMFPCEFCKISQKTFLQKTPG